MKFSDMKTSKPIEVKTITVNDCEIKVQQNLSTNDIYDLIMITLQESKEDLLYNPLKLNVFFHVNLIMMVTDIEFDAEDRLNKFDTYDELVNANILQGVVKELPQDMYSFINELVQTMAKDLNEYENRASASIAQIVQDLPKNAEAAAKIVNEFDPEKYQAVIDFATAANGGRNIVTNEETE